jgi:hypothetical protein
VTTVSETSKATSSATVLSLRLASGLTYRLRSFGVGLRLNFQLPVYATEPTVTVEGSPRDWASALDQRSAVGTELALTATLFL